jgi:hypothetical protein
MDFNQEEGDIGKVKYPGNGRNIVLMDDPKSNGADFPKRGNQ